MVRVVLVAAGCALDYCNGAVLVVDVEVWIRYSAFGQYLAAIADGATGRVEETWLLGFQAVWFSEKLQGGDMTHLLFRA